MGEEGEGRSRQLAVQLLKLARVDGYMDTAYGAEKFTGWGEG